MFDDPHRTCVRAVNEDFVLPDRRVFHIFDADSANGFSRGRSDLIGNFLFQVFTAYQYKASKSLLADFSGLQLLAALATAVIPVRVGATLGQDPHVPPVRGRLKVLPAATSIVTGGGMVGVATLGGPKCYSRKTVRSALTSSVPPLILRKPSEQVSALISSSASSMSVTYFENTPRLMRPPLWA